jgi:hypothetical protein
MNRPPGVAALTLIIGSTMRATAAADFARGIDEFPFHPFARFGRLKNSPEPKRTQR